MEDGGLGAGFAGPGTSIGALELPGISTLVVQEAWVVVALVEELEHAGEDLGEFLGQADALRGGFEELAPHESSEVGRGVQDGLVAGKETAFSANHDSDNGRREGTV